MKDSARPAIRPEPPGPTTSTVRAAVLCYRDGRQRLIPIGAPPPAAIVERLRPAAGDTAASRSSTPLRGTRFRRGPARNSVLTYNQEPQPVPPADLRCRRCARFADLVYVQRLEAPSLGASTPPTQLCARCYHGSR